MRHRAVMAMAAIGAGALLLLSAPFALASRPTTGNECKNGGYNALVGTAGQTFANQGECISYAQSGGQLAPRCSEWVTSGAARRLPGF
jgi:hypothetical protein